MEDTTKQIRRLPSWLRRAAPAGDTYERTAAIVESLGLETVCLSACCPNRGQCWSSGTATVMILGSVCTRNCGFCAVTSGKPTPPDPTEPERIAELTQRLGLKYIVITSVTRDDLEDGGARQFCSSIKELKNQVPGTRVEILTPDFRDCQEDAIEILTEEPPFVFAHNIETVAELYPKVRPGADYDISLNLLAIAKRRFNRIICKSSIMLGVGETNEQVQKALADLRDVGCERLTIGQYLKPNDSNIDVVEYVRPEKFQWWKQKAHDMGFSWVCSEPFARSSYLAQQ
jgi:lipoic acid synthetase